MSDIIQLRLLKTEFEKLMTLALIGSFVEAVKKEPGIRTDQMMKMLMLIAEHHGLKNLVTREDGELAIAEKTVQKMEKLFSNYNKVVFEQLSINQERKNKEKNCENSSFGEKKKIS